MDTRQARWHRRLDRLDTGSPSEPLFLNEAMISQWLQEHRAEYNSATETIKACLVNFGLHRRHRKLVWDVYSKTDFSHLKGGGE
ncbi:hypothetical protein ACFLVO_02885 [Chloroflexota bacterium]